MNTDTVQLAFTVGPVLAVMAADAEAQAWIDLGVPLTPDLRRIVENKYPIANV